MDIKISVIIPVYNAEQYLYECMDSIVKQTLKEIEIIAVNDGSTDASLSILNQYARKYDNIAILIQKNQGPGSARNNGIRHAKGKYLIFIDPDDFYPTNDCLEALYRAAEENNALICGGIIMRNRFGIRTKMEAAGRSSSEKYHLNKMVKVRDYPDAYSYQRYLFKADLIKENNIYFPDYRRFQDPPFAVKAMTCAGEFYELDKEVYDYRIGHKEVNYSLENSIGVLCGVRDVLKIAQEYDWIKLYENRFKNIDKSYMIPFYKYSYCGNREVDDTIEEINEIVKKWIGNEESLIVTKEKVQKTREHCQKERKMIIETLRNDGKKIIYGDGQEARKFLEWYQSELNNVIGIAVTKAQDNADKFLAGLCVKEVEEYLSYSREALVMIVTVPQYREEIEQNLKRLGFHNILKINTGGLELAEVSND